MSFPCHECPVLAICLIRFKKDSLVICDIVWKYIVQDTEHEYRGSSPLPGPTRHKRHKEANKLFPGYEISPEDQRDLL